MKKILMAAMFGMVMMAVPLSSAFAQVDCTAQAYPRTTTANGPKPGCTCPAATVQDNYNKAKRVEATAIDQQITKQNDNSIGMTCFDHALKLTSKLGLIFSDIPTTGTFPAANERVFGTVYDAAFGTGANPITGEIKTLANSLDHVITDMMQAVADDFEDSLSNWLGATDLNFMSSFMAPIDALIAQLLAPLAAIQGAITTIQNTMNTIITLLDTLNSFFPSLAPAWINGAIIPLWNQIKTTMLNAVQTAQTQIMTQVVNALNTFLGGGEASLTAPDPTSGDNPNDPAKGECSRMQRLWNPVSITGQELVGSFRPVEGGGTEMGTPYTNFMNLVNKNVPGAGESFMQQIFNTSNMTVLQNALTDLQAGGALAAPGNDPALWPAVFGTVTPGTGGVFPSIGGAAMSAIRGAM